MAMGGAVIQFAPRRFSERNPPRSPVSSQVHATFERGAFLVTCSHRAVLLPRNDGVSKVVCEFLCDLLPVYVVTIR